MEKLTLGWGCKRALPEGVTAAWGARLIAPADLVSSRQDLVVLGKTGPSEEGDALLEWLNGGALAAAREKLRELRIPGNSEELVTLYEDERGTIAGSAQSSHGYIHVAAWLREHVGG